MSKQVLESICKFSINGHALFITRLQTNNLTAQLHMLPLNSEPKYQATTNSISIQLTNTKQNSKQSKMFLSQQQRNIFHSSLIKQVYKTLNTKSCQPTHYISSGSVNSIKPTYFSNSLFSSQPDMGEVSPKSINKEFSFPKTGMKTPSTIISNFDKSSEILFRDPLSGIPVVFRAGSPSYQENMKHNFLFFLDMQIDTLFNEMCDVWVNENVTIEWEGYSPTQELQEYLMSIGIPKDQVEEKVHIYNKSKMGRSSELFSKAISPQHLFMEYKAYPYVQIEWNE